MYSTGAQLVAHNLFTSQPPDVTCAEH